MRPERPLRPGPPAATALLADARGMTLIEALIAATISLGVMIGMYGLLETSHAAYVNQTDLTSSWNQGRVALELMSRDAREAGYSPLGARFNAIPTGDATRITLVADRNGNGLVGTAGEPDERLTYEFWDPEGDGLHILFRGIDLNADGDFTDSGESTAEIARDIVRIDVNRDGTVEPLIAYDQPPPATRTIQLAFGLRTTHRSGRQGRYNVVSFQNRVLLRNRN